MASLLFDIQSGIAGDMIVAAALDLGIDRKAFFAEMRKLGLKFEARLETVRRGGVSARLFSVRYPHQHCRRNLRDVLRIIGKSGLPEPVKLNAGLIFRRLASAEARVHGTEADKVHFHEVGAVDAIADITGAALAFHLLKVDRCFVTPFTLGYGTVKTEHGVLGLPAPATVELIRGFPARRLDVEGELVTPTGAVVATTLARPVSEMGTYTCTGVGYGAGTRELPGMPNVLRLLLCEESGGGGERVIEIETNVDDASGEVLGRAFERLMEHGALDVFLTPVTMKKGRPGVLITVLCRSADREALSKILLAETGSIGLRFCEKERICLKRKAGTVRTRFGEVKVKIIDLFGDRAVTPEYESCRKISEKTGATVREIYTEVQKSIGRD